MCYTSSRVSTLVGGNWSLECWLARVGREKRYVMPVHKHCSMNDGLLSSLGSQGHIDLDMLERNGFWCAVVAHGERAVDRWSDQVFAAISGLQVSSKTEVNAVQMKLLTAVPEKLRTARPWEQLCKLCEFHER